ncbi:proton-conducting transporter membrane subunit [uncultured Cohaesibacter sp.]|uniref:proton-conducting transporter transmembrane domain-containing protein n=1 Tax=uncultured Cohaesibacter sp. TaxID=1002546 RepID=UPI00292DE79C|nr:proton-conducting transporter membrane subunit [uncultured Cohaesibacter sp.]
MVIALYIIVAGLGGAFALGLVKENRVQTAYSLTLAFIAVMALIALGWTYLFATGSAEPFDILTAGTKPPFAINLHLGLNEAVILSLITVAGLLSAIVMRDVLLEHGHRAMAVYLVLIMALSGLVMTRDIFNLFVFIELIVIASAGLILLSDDNRTIAAGFKYLVVSQIISILLLIGIIFVYHANGFSQYRRHRRNAIGICWPSPCDLPCAGCADIGAQTLSCQWLGAGHLRGSAPWLCRPFLGSFQHGGVICSRQAVYRSRGHNGLFWQPASGSSPSLPPTSLPSPNKVTDAFWAIPLLDRLA